MQSGMCSWRPPVGRVWGILLAALAAFLLCVPAAGAADSSQGWWIVVKSAACVQGPRVLLGEIAEPRGDLSAADWKRLAARQLWNLPGRPGRQVAFSRERLAVLFAQYAADIAPACALPQQIVIQRGGLVLEAGELKRRVVAFLTERAARFGGQTDITDLHVPNYIFFQEAHEKLELTSSAPEVKAGRVNMLFTVRRPGGGLGRRFAASAFLNVWKSLPVAARGMCRRERLNLAYVHYKRKNLAYNQDAWDGTGGPWRLAKNVGIEQVILRRDLEPVPVVAKGGRVNLVFERPGLRLSVKAEALSDGGVGETITVRNLQSNRKVSAQVRDAETVVVH